MDSFALEPGLVGFLACGAAMIVGHERKNEVRGEGVMGEDTFVSQKILILNSSLFTRQTSSRTSTAAQATSASE